MGPDRLKRRRNSIAYKLARLADFSLILARNSEDASARRQKQPRGAAVQYVIDTNILTTFICPSQGQTSVNLFHAPPWSFPDDALEINIDAALVATELVLNVAQAANRGGCVFMTKGHHSELESRVHKLLESLRIQVSQEGDDSGSALMKGVNRLSDACRLLDDVDAARTEMRTAPVVPPLGGQPIDDAVLPDWIVKDYVIRRLCRALSTDNYVEPLEQIERLQKQVLPIVRLIDIGSALPASESASIDRWEGLIWNEVYLARGGYPQAGDTLGLEGGEGSRSQATVRADAEALTYLTWLNTRQSNGGPTYLFVTADKVLANAYRRWHLSDDGRGPYLVRQLNHFAPLFNLKDGQSVHGSAQDVFARTHFAIESLLIPLDLAQTGMDGRPGAGELRSREAFALEAGYQGASDGDVFDRAFVLPHNESYMGEQEERLDSAVWPMLALERYAIGALPTLIQDRLSEDKVKLLSALNPDRESDDEIRKWIENKFRTIHSLSFQFAVQGAAASILNTAGSKETEGLRREFRLRLQFGSDHAPMDQTAFLDHLRAQSKEDVLDVLQTMRAKPHLIFALASVLAFQRQHWADAIRFAGLAASSAGIHSPALDAVVDADAVNECRYLKAISLRFRIGAFAQTQARGFLTAVREWRDIAAQELDEIIRDHTRASKGSELPLVRIQRAYSERAALNLFYCDVVCAYGIPSSELHQIQIRNGVERALIDGVRALRHCLRLEPLVEKALKHDAERPGNLHRKGLFEQVRRQYLANSVSARLIYHWLSSTGEAAVISPNPSLEGMLEALPPFFALDGNSGLSADSAEPIFLLYALAGDALVGKDITAGIRRLKTLIDEDSERQLPLDLALVRRFIRDYRAGAFPMSPIL